MVQPTYTINGHFINYYLSPTSVSTTTSGSRFKNTSDPKSDYTILFLVQFSFSRYLLIFSSVLIDSTIISNIFLIVYPFTKIIFIQRFCGDGLFSTTIWFTNEITSSLVDSRRRSPPLLHYYVTLLLPQQPLASSILIDACSCQQQPPDNSTHSNTCNSNLANTLLMHLQMQQLQPIAFCDAHPTTTATRLQPHLHCKRRHYRKHHHYRCIPHLFLRNRTTIFICSPRNCHWSRKL